MGYMRHKALVITSFDNRLINEAHKKALEIITENEEVTEIIEGRVNAYHTFFIGPDGSKEGWSDSDIADKERDEFIKWVDSKAYEDGSNALQFTYVFYGDDEGDSEIISHN